MKRMGFAHESTHNETKEWYTPAWLFDKLGVTFDLDPASPGKDVVPWIPAAKHLTIRDNGLKAPWAGNVWLNPPYGMDTPKWLSRLFLNEEGITLVFARPDTGWFHRFAIHADAWCFLKRRMLFVPAHLASDYNKGLYVPGKTPYHHAKANSKGEHVYPDNGAGAGSMLLAFGSKNADAFERLHDDGMVVRKGDGYCYELPAEPETHRTERRFAGDTDRPYENPPRPAGTLF